MLQCYTVIHSNSATAESAELNTTLDRACLCFPFLREEFHFLFCGGAWSVGPGLQTVRLTLAILVLPTCSLDCSLGASVEHSSCTPAPACCVHRPSAAPHAHAAMLRYSTLPRRYCCVRHCSDVEPRYTTYVIAMRDVRHGTRHVVRDTGCIQHCPPCGLCTGTSCCQ
jgi:hypothetical protein